MRVFLALLLILPAAQGAIVLDDGPGDVMAIIAAQETVAIPSGVRDGIDIIDLHVEEDATEIRFILTVASMDDLAASAVEDTTFITTFKHGQMTYEIYHQALLKGDDSARLNYMGPGDTFPTYGEPIDLDVDLSSNTFTYRIDRYDLPDHNGAPPALGVALRDIEVVSEAPVLISTLVSLYPGLVTLILFGEHKIAFVQDKAGIDEAAKYDVQIGVEQTGSGRLFSERSYRTSNGEAGTFVYWVEAVHQGAGSGQYELQAEDIPTGWVVRTPPGTFEIAEGNPLLVPVIVETAFAHNHGATEEFLLKLVDQQGDSGKILMGIRYPAIPQPAGHHNTIYLHSRPGNLLFETPLDPAHEAAFGNKGSEVAYMNAMEDDPNDLEAAVDMDGCGGSLQEARYCRTIHLEPGLDMGLDAIMGEQGTLYLPMDASFGEMTVQVEGTMIYTIEEAAPPLCPTCAERTQTVPTTIATIPLSEPVTLGSGSTEIELPIFLNDEADYIPYDPTGQLQLRINVTTDQPNPAGTVNVLTPSIEPRIVNGGYMTLPLNEYKDSVAGIPSLGQDIEWDIDVRERLGNPGDVLLYQPALTNIGDEDTFTLRIVGHNGDWAELLSPATITLGNNETAHVPIVVRIPADAALDATAELVVEAASTTELSRRALLQLRSQLTDEETPDDAALVDGLPSDEKKSPGAAPLLALLVVALALLRRR